MDEIARRVEAIDIRPIFIAHPEPVKYSVVSTITRRRHLRSITIQHESLIVHAEVRERAVWNRHDRVCNGKQRKPKF